MGPCWDYMCCLSSWHRLKDMSLCVTLEATSNQCSISHPNMVCRVWAIGGYGPVIILFSINNCSITATIFKQYTNAVHCEFCELTATNWSKHQHGWTQISCQQARVSLLDNAGVNKSQSKGLVHTCTHAHTHHFLTLLYCSVSMFPFHLFCSHISLSCDFISTCCSVMVTHLSCSLGPFPSSFCPFTLILCFRWFFLSNLRSLQHLCDQSDSLYNMSLWIYITFNISIKCHCRVM